MALDYKMLASAGLEKYGFEHETKIEYPEGETVEWYGFVRHNFEIEGCKAFIVEPPNPAPGLPWSWCLQWAEAFVPRTPALKLLERGFHHVHIDVFSTRMNPEGIQKAEKFYALLQKMGFHKKAALIGMSYGGLFSWRWAAEHPETVGAIYADCPVCNLAFASERNSSNATPEMLEVHKSEGAKNIAAYGVKTHEEMQSHPLSPLNNYKPIAEAKIPILVLRGAQDQTVLPQTNIDIFAERIKSAGGDITVINRECYGHHPHGMDDPRPLVDFILRHYPEF